MYESSYCVLHGLHGTAVSAVVATAHPAAAHTTFSCQVRRIIVAFFFDK
eukprot:COSAG01_NODE_4176_length_5267_cov_34.739164_8_plen_49_part_00